MKESILWRKSNYLTYPLIQWWGERRPASCPPHSQPYTDTVHHPEGPHWRHVAPGRWGGGEETGRGDGHCEATSLREWVYHGPGRWSAPSLRTRLPAAAAPPSPEEALQETDPKSRGWFIILSFSLNIYVCIGVFVHTVYSCNIHFSLVQQKITII